MASQSLPEVLRPPPPGEWTLPFKAWNLLGGVLDWAGVEWVAAYLGVDDVDALILDLIELRAARR